MKGRLHSVATSNLFLTKKEKIDLKTTFNPHLTPKQFKQNGRNQPSEI